MAENVFLISETGYAIRTEGIVKSGHLLPRNTLCKEAEENFRLSDLKVQFTCESRLNRDTDLSRT